MLNLFSIFDPYTFWGLSMNWFSTILFMLIIPQLYWLMSMRFIYLVKMILFFLWFEFKVILISKFNVVNLIFFNTLFLFIVLNNFLGLFSYIFTSSSHMVFSVTFSLSMWIGLMYFGWLKNTNFMFIHLVPQGTPLVLMFFMVLIEMLSNLIRPLTLSIRLSANMIAGHLLMTLLGNFIPNFLYFYMLIILIQLSLFILELGVSIIQSYVFVILMILYFKETN